MFTLDRNSIEHQTRDYIGKTVSLAFQSSASDLQDQADVVSVITQELSLVLESFQSHYRSPYSFLSDNDWCFQIGMLLDKIAELLTILRIYVRTQNAEEIIGLLSIIEDLRLRIEQYKLSARKDNAGGRSVLDRLTIRIAPLLLIMITIAMIIILGDRNSLFTKFSIVMLGILGLLVVLNLQVNALNKRRQ